LVRAYENDCRFDGWSDRFDFATWQRSIEESQVDVSFYTSRQKEFEEPLPWDHIDVRVEKAFLIKEWMNALEGAKTEDCRWHSCQQCGVCDFETIEPHLFESTVKAEPRRVDKSDIALQTASRKLKLFYSKRGNARFFGHLELVNIINRALRRAGVKLAYSGGFHPMPKISFDDPLPMGMEGVDEFFFISVKSDIECEEVVRRTNDELPEGLFINRCEVASTRPLTQGFPVDRYTVTLKEGVFDRQQLDWFFESGRVEYRYTNKKGVSGTIDLRTVILSIDLIKPNSIQLLIQNQGGKHVRPAMVLERVFALPAEDIKQASIIKGGIHV
jgi:radical SAM-linked protein